MVIQNFIGYLHRLIMKTEYTCLYQDNKTREELLNNIEICKTSYEDAMQIIHVLKKGLNIKSDRETLRQLLYTDAQLNESVKVIDKRDGTIYGVLIFSNFPIQQGSPLCRDNYELCSYLTQFKQVNGFAFIIDERLRGTDVHKDMVMYNMSYLEGFDFVWCGVEKNLKSHNYWLRLGFEEIVRNCDASFYIKFFNKKRMLEIFIIKMLFLNANHY